MERGPSQEGKEPILVHPSPTQHLSTSDGARGRRRGRTLKLSDSSE